MIRQASRASHRASDRGEVESELLLLLRDDRIFEDHLP